MCLIITGILCALAINFYMDGDMTQAVIYGVISLLFLALFAYNISSAKKRKTKKQEE